MRMVDIDTLMTMRHYAELHGIVVQTVYERVRKGKVKSLRIDGRIFVTEDDNNSKEERK